MLTEQYWHGLQHCDRIIPLDLEREEAFAQIGAFLQPRSRSPLQTLQSSAIVAESSQLESPANIRKRLGSR